MVIVGALRSMLSRLRIALVVILAVLLGGLILWPRPLLGAEIIAAASGAAPGGEGAALFAQHCAACHGNGGNVIRRSKTLKLAALKRAGLEGPEAVARVAAAGQGQMGGYGDALGPGGAEIVGAWVWQQAQAGWPKPEQNLNQP